MSPKLFLYLSCKDQFEIDGNSPKKTPKKSPKTSPSKSSRKSPLQSVRKSTRNLYGTPPPAPKMSHFLPQSNNNHEKRTYEKARSAREAEAVREAAIRGAAVREAAIREAAVRETPASQAAGRSFSTTLPRLHQKNNEYEPSQYSKSSRKDIASESAQHKELTVSHKVQPRKLFAEEHEGKMMSNKPTARTIGGIYGIEDIERKQFKMRVKEKQAKQKKSMDENDVPPGSYANESNKEYRKHDDDDHPPVVPSQSLDRGFIWFPNRDIVMRDDDRGIYGIEDKREKQTRKKKSMEEEVVPPESYANLKNKKHEYRKDDDDDVPPTPSMEMRRGMFWIPN